MLKRQFDNAIFSGELELNDRQFTVRYKVSERPFGETVEKTFRLKDRESARQRYAIIVQWMERAAVNRRGLMAFGIDVLKDDPRVIRPGQSKRTTRKRSRIPQSDPPF